MHADTSEVAKGEFVVNPDAVKNQPEGGMIQSANWAAQGAGPVRQRDGRPDRLGKLPVLRFGEVPKIDIELVNGGTDMPLGIGEATAGAIGNAASRALSSTR